MVADITSHAHKYPAVSGTCATTNMKDFALIVKKSGGQTFGISGKYVLENVPPMEGCANRWRFDLSDGETLEVIIVAKEKKMIAVLAGHFLEVLKARVRRIGTSLSQI